MRNIKKFFFCILLVAACHGVQAQWGGGTTEDVTINRAGSVVIGGGSPANATLHVKKSTTATATGELLWVDGRIRTNSIGGGMWLSNDGSGFIGNNDVTTTNFGFYTPGLYPSGTHIGWRAFQIKKSTGFVGISTDQPNALVSLGYERANTKLALFDAGAGSMYGLGIQDYQFRLHLGDPAAQFSFLNGEDGNELMTIKGDGSVGIGTVPADATFKLSVNGRVRAREVKVYSAWADYVFNPSYQLRPLTQVEAFIKANQHLPDVPSAADVEKEGIDLGEMDATLLRKIEELTLYVIEQNKKMEALQQENQQQAQQIEQLRTKEKK